MQSPKVPDKKTGQQVSLAISICAIQRMLPFSPDELTSKAILENAVTTLLQASDNTRHLSRHPKTGELYVVPPDQMRRVVLCSGPIYYHLSNARRQRKIRNIALIRLEQLAPFPHDLLVEVQIPIKFVAEIGRLYPSLFGSFCLLSSFPLSWASCPVGFRSLQMWSFRACQESANSWQTWGYEDSVSVPG